MSNPTTKHLEDAMVKMRGLSARIDILTMENSVSVQRWELAQNEGNGIEESKQREHMHNLMDQILDLRAEAIQLVKTFPK